MVDLRCQLKEKITEKQKRYNSFKSLYLQGKKKECEQHQNEVMHLRC